MTPSHKNPTRRSSRAPPHGLFPNTVTYWIPLRNYLASPSGLPLHECPFTNTPFPTKSPAQWFHLPLKSVVSLFLHFVKTWMTLHPVRPAQSFPFSIKNNFDRPIFFFFALDEKRKSCIKRHEKVLRKFLPSVPCALNIKDVTNYIELPILNVFYVNIEYPPCLDSDPKWLNFHPPLHPFVDFSICL